MPFLNSKAPRFQGIEGWLNSDPVDMEEGNFLLDFWTYSCKECKRKAEILQVLEDAYPEINVIGVHSPRFDFESPENVSKAVEKLDLDYSVALDPEKTTTELYDIVYASRQFLIADGEIVWQSRGEDVGSLEEKITEVLKIEEKNVMPPSNVEHGRLENIHLGFRGREEINDSAGFCGRKALDVPENRKSGKVYLDAEWERQEDFLEASENSTMFHGSSASEINVVVDPGEGIKDVEVMVDGGKVPEEMAGEDLRIEDNRSYIRAKHPDVYSIVENEENEHLELVLRPDKGTKIFELQLGKEI